MRTTKLLLVVVLAVGGYFGYRHFRQVPERAVGQAEDPALILDRVWIDGKPKKAQDIVHAMFLTERLSLGVFQKGSAYRVLLERFRHQRDGRTLRLQFPQNKRKESISFQIHSCNDLPPFDLCLELSRNPWEQGPLRYYSKRETKGSDLAELQRELQAQVARQP